MFSSLCSLIKVIQPAECCCVCFTLLRLIIFLKPCVAQSVADQHVAAGGWGLSVGSLLLQGRSQHTRGHRTWSLVMLGFALRFGSLAKPLEAVDPVFQQEL